MNHATHNSFKNDGGMTLLWDVSAKQHWERNLTCPAFGRGKKYLRIFTLFAPLSYASCECVIWNFRPDHTLFLYSRQSLSQLTPPLWFRVISSLPSGRTKKCFGLLALSLADMNHRFRWCLLPQRHADPVGDLPLLALKYGHSQTFLPSAPTSFPSSLCRFASRTRQFQMYRHFRKITYLRNDPKPILPGSWHGDNGKICTKCTAVIPNWKIVHFHLTSLLVNFHLENFDVWNIMFFERSFNV